MKGNETLQKGIQAEILFETVEELFDISEFILKSGLRHRKVSDIRKMICFLLHFKLGVKKKLDIAAMMNIDHSSVSVALKKHKEIMSLKSNDPPTVDYQENFNRLFKVVKEKLTQEQMLIRRLNRLKNEKKKIKEEIRLLEKEAENMDISEDMKSSPEENNKEPSSITLRQINNGTHMSFIEMMGFISEKEAIEAKKKFNLKNEFIIYEGDPFKVDDKNVENVVDHDDKQYIRDIFKMKEYERLGWLGKDGVGASKYYKNYATGDFDIRDHPSLSFISAHRSLKHKSYIIVYSSQRKLTREEREAL